MIFILLLFIIAVEIHLTFASNEPVEVDIYFPARDSNKEAEIEDLLLSWFAQDVWAIPIIDPKSFCDNPFELQISFNLRSIIASLNQIG